MHLAGNNITNRLIRQAQDPCRLAALEFRAEREPDLERDGERADAELNREADHNMKVRSVFTIYTIYLMDSQIKN